MIDIQIKPLTSSITKVTLLTEGEEIELGELDYADRRVLVSDLAGIIQELCEC
jgi:hypothetical protein